MKPIYSDGFLDGTEGKALHNQMGRGCGSCQMTAGVLWGERKDGYVVSGIVNFVPPIPRVAQSREISTVRVRSAAQDRRVTIVRASCEH